MDENHQHALHASGEPEPTEKMREYLEVIYYLAARNEPVISARLAEWMKVTAPTVSNIVSRMEKQGYIHRDGRGEITLTEQGYAQAEAMVKRHRVLECFLVEVMGVPWHQIHEEAVRLEHALSPTLEARIEALVSCSQTCPHGNPIPGSGATYIGTVRLSQVEPGQRWTLQRIVEEAEEDSELMRWFQENNLVPGTTFDVTSNSATYGVTLKNDSHSITLTPKIASQIWGEVG